MSRTGFSSLGRVAVPRQRDVFHLLAEDSERGAAHYAAGSKKRCDTCLPAMRAGHDCMAFSAGIQPTWAPVLGCRKQPSAAHEAFLTEPFWPENGRWHDELSSISGHCQFWQLFFTYPSMLPAISSHTARYRVLLLHLRFPSIG